jgi:hypothetical protein
VDGRLPNAYVVHRPFRRNRHHRPAIDIGRSRLGKGEEAVKSGRVVRLPTRQVAWAGLKFVVVLYVTAVAFNIACAGVILALVGGRIDAALLTAIGGITALIGGIYNAFP